MTTTLRVLDDAQAADEATGDREQRQGGIRAGVLAALGRPGELYRVAVVPLWGNHFRVNVITGADPTALRIPHSYFVAADEGGTILECTPSIRKVY